MWVVQSILLGISLAIDAFAVSISDGLIERKMKVYKMLFITLMFGVFQGVMPLIEYLFGSIFTKWIHKAIPIICFGVLMFLGVKMFIEGIKMKKMKKKFPH